MGNIIKIKNEAIETSLIDTTRQYFVGNLKKPQKLPFFKSEELEIGITSYDSFTSEPTHFHTIATEYQYMISGQTQYMDVDTKEVFEFNTGDFYMIESNTKYAQRSKAGTKILFIKVPSINDKQVPDVDDDVTAWLSEKF